MLDDKNPLPIIEFSKIQMPQEPKEIAEIIFEDSEDKADLVYIVGTSTSPNPHEGEVLVYSTERIVYGPRKDVFNCKTRSLSKILHYHLLCKLDSKEE
ncbi:hypothetical protein GOV13_00080 [Candidatus Pacearchaeota archaeon]|nr:hypothetical protein [Candidatus Pacearchaeota archaeon]